MSDSNQSTDSNEYPDDVQAARNRVLAESDRDVWVVERNPGSGWRVCAVLPSFEAAQRYEEDLRTVMNHCPEDFPEKYFSEIRTRHGSRQSPTTMFDDYPPQTDRGAHR
jgi:hypothetical protein